MEIYILHEDDTFVQHAALNINNTLCGLPQERYIEEDKWFLEHERDDVQICAQCYPYPENPPGNN